jgi:hypothetical protein
MASEGLRSFLARRRDASRFTDYQPSRSTAAEHECRCPLILRLSGRLNSNTDKTLLFGACPLIVRLAL